MSSGYAMSYRWTAIINWRGCELMRLYVVALVSIVVALALADPAFAQEWGDLEGANSLVEWLTTEVAVVVVIFALFGAFVIGLWQQSWLAGIAAFVAIAIIASVVGNIPEIAEGLVS